jgi:hypothetical protein
LCENRNSNAAHLPKRLRHRNKIFPSLQCGIFARAFFLLRTSGDGKRERAFKTCELNSVSLPDLLATIGACKERGVHVALSIDGSKKSGQFICDIPIPTGLFEREVAVNVGRSMLRRFQRGGDTLEDEVVHDRLLLTY